MEKSRFFREVTRLANSHDFHVSGITDEGRLELSSSQHYLCRIDESGAIYYPQKNEAELDTFISQVEAARKYVTAVEQSPPLVAEGLPDGYRLLCQHEKTVLAGKDMGAHGFQFVTWEWGYDRTGLNHGHYYDSYIAAKEDFGFRSGLVPNHYRFSPEQAKAIYRATSIIIEYGLFESNDEYSRLLESQCKLEAAYSDLAEQSLTPEQHPEHEPTMTM
ncbi:hypothetical protein LJC63_00535 [Ruminococcaceae bacterium OttesenSCG-928-L11]|nr:hypothetical protein [Ruminococcaceae bacterium OttesenSCG-928-L11]